MSIHQHYSDHRPYPKPPATLTDLAGPTTGSITLPPQIDWGPPRRYDMGSETDRRVVYERVLREATSTDEVCRYVNGAALLEVWRHLWLPSRLRTKWERQLPELMRAA